MSTHHTKNKGDIALTKVIADLTERGYSVSLPVSEHLRYDLIVDVNSRLLRVQVKYSVDCVLYKGTVYASVSEGKTIRSYYADEDFDFYAAYLPEKDVIIYPSIEFAGAKINVRPSNSNHFWWYEDFLDFTTKADVVKHTCKTFRKGTQVA